MRSLSILLSFLLHGAIASLALFFPFGGEARIDLDKPVYEVELLRLPQKKTPSKPEPPKQGPAKVKPPPKAKQPEAARGPAERRSKASQPKAVKIPDKQKRVAKRPKKKAQDKPAPEKRPQRPPPKPKSSPPAPTKDEVLAQALGEAQEEAKKSEESAQDILSRELASIEQTVDRNRTAQGAGGRPRGTTVADIYSHIVETRIKEHWRFPSFGGSDNLQAEVELQIDAGGRIIEYALVKKSGRNDFDRSVLRAVDETEKLPSPPREDIRTIRVTFNLQEKQG